MQPRPIIPWPGSKRRLASRLLPIFEQLEHTCYVEPFAGAAAMLFARQPAKVEVLNDINRDLVLLYRCVTHHLDEFVRQFRWALTSREMFRWAQLEHTDTLTDIQRAARFFYLQHHSFAGKVDGQTFGVATTARVGINLLRLEETLSAAHLRLHQVIIEHLRWQDCMERYDRPHTLLFCDPPYWRTEGYGVAFPWAEYEALEALGRKCAGKVVITLNDHQDIRQLFRGWNMQSVPITYTMGNHSGAGARRHELIITRR